MITETKKKGWKTFYLYFWPKNILKKLKMAVPNLYKYALVTSENTPRDAARNK